MKMQFKFNFFPYVLLRANWCWARSDCHTWTAQRETNQCEEGRQTCKHFLWDSFCKSTCWILKFSPPEPWNDLRDATSYPPLWELLRSFVYRTCSCLSVVVCLLGYRGLIFLVRSLYWLVVNMLPVLKYFIRTAGLGNTKNSWEIPVFGNHIFSLYCAETIQLFKYKYRAVLLQVVPLTVHN